MSARVVYEKDGAIVTVTMDDGKANALSPAMLSDLGDAFHQAADDASAVVLRGREGLFSAGFDLPTLQGGGPEAAEMLTGGFLLAERMLSFPVPVVMACTGHAVAMGLFLLLSGDHRVGAAGPYRLVANEVAIGLTMPRAAVEVCRQRLTPAAFVRVVTLAEQFSPEDGVAAGILDDAVPAGEVDAAARKVAERLSLLDRRAYVATKRRARADVLVALRAAIEADDADVRALLT